MSLAATHRRDAMLSCTLFVEIARPPFTLFLQETSRSVTCSAATYASCPRTAPPHRPSTATAHGAPALALSLHLQTSGKLHTPAARALGWRSASSLRATQPLSLSVSSLSTPSAAGSASFEASRRRSASPRTRRRAAPRSQARPRVRPRRRTAARHSAPSPRDSPRVRLHIGARPADTPLSTLHRGLCALSSGRGDHPGRIRHRPRAERVRCHHHGRRWRRAWRLERSIPGG